MALAESMKNFVNELKASRRSRHGFVKGNREIAKNIMAENRKAILRVREQNKINAQQTHAFLQSAKEERAQGQKLLMEGIHADIARIRQAKEAITQGARGMLKELREDTQRAHEYWASLADDEPIEEPKAQTKAEKAKVSKEEKEQKE
jgi:hypothetical protein